MTRRVFMHKWSLYGLALALVWLADTLILPRYPVLGLTPMLLPLAAAAVASLEGSGGGAGFGLAVGLVWELGYPGGYGFLVLGMTLAGLSAGLLAQYVLRASLPGCLICSAVVLGAVDGLRLFRGLLTQSAPLSTLLYLAGGEWLLSLCWCPVVYLLFRQVYRRVRRRRTA